MVTPIGTATKLYSLQYTDPLHPLLWGPSLHAGEMLLSPAEKRRGRICKPPSDSLVSLSSSSMSAEVHSPMLSVKDAHDPMLEDDLIRRKSWRWVLWYLRKHNIVKLIEFYITSTFKSYWEGRTTTSSWPRETVPATWGLVWLAVINARSEGAKSNGVNPKLVQIELQICEWKNKAIPLVPKFPSPYSVPGIKVFISLLRTN